jgi:hypothetical protein
MSSTENEYQAVTELGRKIFEVVEAEKPSTAVLLATVRDVAAYVLSETLCAGCREQWVEQLRDKLRAQSDPPQSTCH